MSDGPMDRSDPSEKPSYGRTFILPMAKLRNFTEGESIALKGEASPALEMSAALMDRSEKPSYGRTFFYRWQNDVIIQWGKV